MPIVLVHASLLAGTSITVGPCCLRNRFDDTFPQVLWHVVLHIVAIQWDVHWSGI